LTLFGPFLAHFGPSLGPFGPPLRYMRGGWDDDAPTLTAKDAIHEVHQLVYPGGFMYMRRAR
jgi:hypothetical protein